MLQPHSGAHWHRNYADGHLLNSIDERHIYERYEYGYHPPETLKKGILVGIRGTLQSSSDHKTPLSDALVVDTSALARVSHAPAFPPAHIYIQRVCALCMGARIQAWACARFGVILYFVLRTQYSRRRGSAPSLGGSPQRRLRPCPIGRK